MAQRIATSGLSAEVRYQLQVCPNNLGLRRGMTPQTPKAFLMPCLTQQGRQRHPPDAW